ncbi:hypothetical protein D3C71_1429370 [compost metagenome]
MPHPWHPRNTPRMQKSPCMRRESCRRGWWRCPADDIPASLAPHQPISAAHNGAMQHFPRCQDGLRSHASCGNPPLRSTHRPAPPAQPRYASNSLPARSPPPSLRSDDPHLARLPSGSRCLSHTARSPGNEMALLPSRRGANAPCSRLQLQLLHCSESVRPAPLHCQALFPQCLRTSRRPAS